MELDLLVGQEFGDESIVLLELVLALHTRVPEVSRVALPPPRRKRIVLRGHEPAIFERRLRVRDAQIGDRSLRPSNDDLLTEHGPLTGDCDRWRAFGSVETPPAEREKEKTPPLHRRDPACLMIITTPALELVTTVFRRRRLLLRPRILDELTA